MRLTPNDIIDIMSSLTPEQARKLRMVLSAFEDVLDGHRIDELEYFTGLPRARCDEISFIWNAVNGAKILMKAVR
jgi:hypothetical protein